MRVTGGKLGGRTLGAPHNRSTRPTADRARQAIFNILTDIEGAHVLDLYAGSGALGIEALSRGAASAVFVEASHAAYVALCDNLSRLDLKEASLCLRHRVERSHELIVEHGPYDLILADPPWDLIPEVCRVLPRLLTREAWKEEARLVLVHSARDSSAPEIPGLERDEERQWGDTGVGFYRFRSLP